MSELILRHLFIKAPRETEFQLKKTQSTSKTIKVTYSHSQYSNYQDTKF